MNKRQQDINDVEFVLSEALRFLRMSPKEIMDEVSKDKTGAFCWIPHPSGDGDLLIGGKAETRLYELAQRHLATQKLLGEKIELREFVRDIKDALVRWFATVEREVDGRNVDRMLSEAVKRTTKKFKELTHFIPCVLVFDEHPEEFSIGPVRFVTKTRFMVERDGDFRMLIELTKRRLEEEVEKAVAKGKPRSELMSSDQIRDHAEHFVSKVAEYLKLYRWIACVSVPSSHDAVSRRRAEFVVQAALDVLKLFLTPYYAKHIRSSYSRGFATEAARLTRDVAGNLAISIGFKSEDALVGKIGLRSFAAMAIT